MTDKPTPTTDLLKRCAEIHEWRSTGVLAGEALRDYAKRKWPDRHDTVQMAEHETVTAALALLAKWGQPAQAADSVQEDAADPLQGAANWLAEAHGQFSPVVLSGCLMIGYNRAKRLHDTALAARKQGENHDR